MIVRYANSGESTSSGILTTKDVTKITDKIFKVGCSLFSIDCGLVLNCLKQ